MDDFDPYLVQKERRTKNKERTTSKNKQEHTGTHKKNRHKEQRENHNVSHHSPINQPHQPQPTNCSSHLLPRLHDVVDVFHPFVLHTRNVHQPVPAKPWQRAKETVVLNVADTATMNGIQSGGSVTGRRSVSVLKTIVVVVVVGVGRGRVLRPPSVAFVVCGAGAVGARGTGGTAGVTGVGGVTGPASTAAAAGVAGITRSTATSSSASAAVQGFHVAFGQG